MPGGSEFHSWGAEREKALFPMVLKGRGRTEEAGGGGDVKKIGQIGRCQAVDGLECEEIEMNYEFNWKPVVLLYDWGDVVMRAAEF